MSETNEKFSTNIDDLLENPFGEEDLQLAELKEANVEQRPKKLIDTLPEASKERAFKLAEQIDPKNHETITLYGTKAQSKLTNFSHSMLDHVKNKNIGEIGNILNELMSKLEQVNPDELQPEKQGFFSKFFGKVSRSVNEILTKYQKTGAQIDRITVKLDHCKNTLMSDNALLDQLYEQNKEYFRALNIYIAAGELKIEELRTTTIPEMKKKAEQSGDQMAYQDVNDMIQFTERLERRIHDLKLSRQITIQSAPQIRLIQNTNQQLIEKIQSSIMTAIPLWKNQIASL